MEDNTFVTAALLIGGLFLFKNYGKGESHEAGEPIEKVDPNLPDSDDVLRYRHNIPGSNPPRFPPVSMIEEDDYQKLHAVDYETFNVVNN